MSTLPPSYRPSATNSTNAAFVRDATYMYQTGPLHVPAVPRPLHSKFVYLDPADAWDIREVATPTGSVFGTDAFPAGWQAIIRVRPFRHPVLVRDDGLPTSPSNGRKRSS
ncbi:hypothetical protein [Hymenobacter terrenus]|uniref:hypothetical protein n=1 Tax=Hymenobacter terrenus TaxID=1629124 RepID=UPI0012E07303|nr:hypothetical protein [Hymenobacter terrenus]